MKKDIEDLCAESIQEAKFENEERLTAFIKNGEDLIKIVDERGIYLYASPSVQNILGLKKVI